MTIASIRPYGGTPKDTEDKFHGNRILYVGWDRHLMFYAPVCFCIPPSMGFADFVAGPLAQAFGEHPQWAQIDWTKANWLKSNQPFSPDGAKSLDDNGLGHKEVLRLQTPGLDGVGGRAI
jgi:phenol hydroxylase P4 protein